MSPQLLLCTPQQHLLCPPGSLLAAHGYNTCRPATRGEGNSVGHLPGHAGGTGEGGLPAPSLRLPPQSGSPGLKCSWSPTQGPTASWVAQGQLLPAQPSPTQLLPLQGSSPLRVLRRILLFPARGGRGQRADPTLDPAAQWSARDMEAPPWSSLHGSCALRWARAGTITILGGPVAMVLGLAGLSFWRQLLWAVGGWEPCCPRAVGPPPKPCAHCPSSAPGSSWPLEQCVSWLRRGH